MEAMSRASAKSGNSGENQANGLCLKYIREKSGNLTNARDDQGNIRKNFCPCFFSQLISQYAKKAGKKTHYAHNEIVGFHFSRRK